MTYDEERCRKHVPMVSAGNQPTVTFRYGRVVSGFEIEGSLSEDKLGACGLKTELHSNCYLHAGQPALYHHCSISRIRKFIITGFEKLFVHVLITSKLDHCNSLMNGKTSQRFSQRTRESVIRT